MNMKTIIALVVGIAIGFGIHSLLPNEATMVDHWRIVREYRDYVLNPPTGSVDEPQELEPSLAALVSAGELRHLDVVLPTVPYSNHDATRHWMAFCERHKDEIVWGYGNPSSVAFPTKGEQPLHLQMWFPESSTPLIQQLISELEKMGNRREPTNSCTTISHRASAMRKE
jgi:hypothetical protein